MSDRETSDTALAGAAPVEGRSTNGEGNNLGNAGFGAVGQVFVRIAETGYADGKELMERARPLEWEPRPTVIDPALGRPVFPNNPDDEIPQGRAGANAPDGRIPLTDDLRFVNQPTGELPQARDISNAVFAQPKDADGVDIAIPNAKGANDFALFFGQALTHDMVETQVNVTAVSIPASTGIGWAGGQVGADGEPTAAILVRVNPQTGQAVRDAQGQVIPLFAPGTPAADQVAALRDGLNLPALTVPGQQPGTTVTIPAVTPAQQDIAAQALVDHQALSLGAPFALQRTPGVYDEDGVRQQANTETAFLDLGNVYGKVVTATVQADAIGDSALITRIGDPFADANGVLQQRIEIDTSQALRARTADGELSAFLLTSDDVASPRAGQNLLPTYREVNENQGLFRDDAATTANEAELAMGAVFDPTLANFFDLDRFAAGDQRVNQNVATVTQQTIWARNHNEWAERIAADNPAMTADEVFQLARAINEAEYQKAVYDEYLTTIIGETGVAMIGDYQGYDPDANPAIINEWTTLAFRFGHDQSSNFVSSLLEDGDLKERVLLIDSFTRAGAGAEASVPNAATLDDWIRGQLSATHEAIDGNVVEGNRGQLFGVTVSPVTGQPVINDLTVFDIVRGRDHGVNSYVHVRAAIGQDTYLFDPDGTERTGEEAFRAWGADNGVSAARLNALIDLYGGDFARLDAYVGVLLEKPHGDSQLGVTSTTLVAMQFQATRDGDRFWYENRLSDQPEILAIIRESSMADVIARTTGIEHVYRDAFLAHDRIGGTEGNDRLSGSADRDLLIGFGGDDRLRGREANDDLYGGAGNDRLEGGADRDRLVGEAGADTLLGGAGDDTLAGGEGNDYLRGEAGADVLKGGAGTDRLLGEGGDDRIVTGGGADRANGGSGDDVIVSGTAAELNGGAGTDAIQVSGIVRVDLNAQRMTDADGAATRVIGVENVTIADGTDAFVFGSSAGNVLTGGVGDDTIDGWRGNDRIATGDGLDVVRIGFGNDAVADFDVLERPEEADHDRLVYSGRAGTIDLGTVAEFFDFFFDAADQFTVRFVADAADAGVIRAIEIQSTNRQERFSASLTLEGDGMTFADGRAFADANGYDRTLLA